MDEEQSQARKRELERHGKECVHIGKLDRQH